MTGQLSDDERRADLEEQCRRIRCQCACRDAGFIALAVLTLAALLFIMFFGPACPRRPLPPTAPMSGAAN